MIYERKPFEINDTNSVIKDGNLIITVPADAQSGEAIDFYFASDFIADKTIIATSAKIESESLIDRFWNWLLTDGGTAEATEVVGLGVDLTSITEPTQGKFGFSALAQDDADIIVTLQLKK